MNLSRFRTTERTIQQQNSDAEDISPNGGYGWICVVACFMLNASAWGINSVSDRVQVLLGLDACPRFAVSLTT